MTIPNVKGSGAQVTYLKELFGKGLTAYPKKRLAKLGEAFVLNP